MASDLPEHYFRVRENGAQVFRVDAQNRNRRLDLDPIATVNLRNGEVRAHGDRRLTEADREAIAAWIEARRRTLAAREIDDILRTVDQLNLTAAWAQSRATEDQLETVTDALLMAMHDLRQVLVRRKAERLAGSGTTGGD